MTMACLFLSMLLAIEQPPGPLESIAREFVNNFNSARFDVASKDFNESMRAVVTPSILADLKQQSDNALGGFRSIAALRQRKEGGFRVIEFVCKYEKSLASFQRYISSAILTVEESWTRP